MVLDKDLEPNVKYVPGLRPLHPMALDDIPNKTLKSPKLRVTYQQQLPLVA